MGDALVVSRQSQDDGADNDRDDGVSDHHQTDACQLLRLISPPARPPIETFLFREAVRGERPMNCLICDLSTGQLPELLNLGNGNQIAAFSRLTGQ